MEFLLIDAGSPVGGSFANVASGDRVNVSGIGSFVVNYGTGAPFADQVRLSLFAPVPEPHHWALVGGCAPFGWAVVRRRPQGKNGR
jgi:hypothetical protein